MRGRPQTRYVEGVHLEHHPDQNKSRSQYLPLLELAVEENPENDRNVHCTRAGVLQLYRRWERHRSDATLALPSATWADERCASMRLLAKDYFALKMEGEGERWLLRAAGEAPSGALAGLQRTCATTLGRTGFCRVLWAVNRALAITQRPRSYISEAVAWGEHPWDLASMGYYYTGQLGKALEAAQKAAELAPDEPRIQTNLQLIQAAQPAG